MKIMSDKEESATKKLGRFLGKKAVEASKILDREVKKAGKIAREILVEGKSPASLPMEPTVKGEPVVSLARAKALGIPVDSNILLTARVLEEFDWEK